MSTAPMLGGSGGSTSSSVEMLGKTLSVRSEVDGEEGLFVGDAGEERVGGDVELPSEDRSLEMCGDRLHNRWTEILGMLSCYGVLLRLC
jgi:hypothetical protein